ncbi:Superfamily I DNA and/or RNA helicase [Geosmithia morbida]|uniref:Superfamily I DNA and/or RNA helicase n=1 Tax=Geosmithia morbida TaxID=1094350 RepID=A0A9P4Z2U7_9HYPO|nr:Superfamily I DNA and/or RNA helicase [Geosmithia morbida]KAF4126208.1 Superfamily I DNA and/or RNA helicase [Geosmithia morbida]
MPQSVSADERDARLQKVLVAFLKGTRSILAPREAQLFLEAVRKQPSPSLLVEKIIASPSGLKAVRQAVRASDTTEHITSHVLPFARYISDPDVKALSGGRLLQKIILAIVDPPTAWAPLLALYTETGFEDSEPSAVAFAWLCLEIASGDAPELAELSDRLSTTLQTRPLLKHASHKVREYAYRIQKILQNRLSQQASDAVLGMEAPGGRHDNDFANFREISIYPTTDELASTLKPFYRTLAEITAADPSCRFKDYVDNLYRLYREEMLYELREELHIATGTKKSRRRPARTLGISGISQLDMGDSASGRPCALIVVIGSGLKVLENRSPDKVRAFRRENPSFLRNQAFGALCSGSDVVGFATIHIDNDLLVGQHPKVGLQFTNTKFLAKVVGEISTMKSLRFILINTPVFAYEPVLKRLKEIRQLPLESQILRLNVESDGNLDGFCPLPYVLPFLKKLEVLESSAAGGVFAHEGDEYTLDAAQGKAVSYALRSPLAIIQGPPGTGKSFVGALVAKLLLEGPSIRILVLSYTNHALDQFLEDLINIGVTKSMTRLGSKSSTVTAPLLFKNQFRASSTPKSQTAFQHINELKKQGDVLRGKVQRMFVKVGTKVSGSDILSYLEFSEDPRDGEFWDAFQVRRAENGFRVMGKGGQPIQEDHLINAWKAGKGPEKLRDLIPASFRFIWDIPKPQRKSYMDKWTCALQQERADEFEKLVDKVNRNQEQIDMYYNHVKCDFIAEKRVIGCTTTAAAKYSSLIEAAKVDCVLVEEAGEILEAHVLTALNHTTKKLILIGDHKQLRPRYNNYDLSVEKGDGYDFNKSMFERLIEQGHLHVTLQNQHRMDPEISQIVRHMTYPDLLDDYKTKSRPAIRGIVGRVVFMNHDKPENDVGQLQDTRDAGTVFSKENSFEVEMVLKLVKYLGQQGYNTSNIVILTPYLGQLRLLRDALIKTTDPILSDFDSGELIRAGLLTSAAGNVDRGEIRLSTIDNYQGEERDIVIASLTRSNERGDIGFMKAPERLNVLVSRARNCLIMIGNMATFINSLQGKDTWVPFFQLLKDKEYLQDGIRVRCEQHPERTSTLASPQDFELKCPDGGCSELCGAQLSCGLHVCKRRCHTITDHTKITCGEEVDKVCEKNHTYKVGCQDRNVRCCRCMSEEEDMRRRLQRNFDLEKARVQRQEAYRKELKEIQDELDYEKRLLKEDRERDYRSRTLEQRRSELAELKETRKRQEAMKRAEDSRELADSKTPSSPVSSDNGEKPQFERGTPEEEWDYLKREELARSEAIDLLMQTMIGLRDVKQAFLNIKSVVDTATRQNVPIKDERFGCSLLGNPGTGKTTVARLYGNLLTSMGVISGRCFKETTGSKLANMGVSGSQKLLDEMLEKGGGVVFIDEAYQLSSGNSPGGKAVLDFLLAEVENLNSKICFVLAGYTKQMEAFFAHNPGLSSRFPHEMKFADYSDDELLKILGSKINGRYKGRMKIEDGIDGLYLRIIAQRLGRGRGKEGFGNARAAENMLSTVYRRQSERLRRERRQKKKPDDLLLTKSDIIGPEPANALAHSEAWKELGRLTGLGSVKSSVKSLVDSIQANYQRELQEKPIIQYSLNRVFLGNPGTGKTTVAKIYGKILVELGLLSKGEVVIKNPADFVGSVLGQSEQQTKGILSACIGKVLVIDEAYGLYGGGGSTLDPYKTAVIDTIVAEVQSVPGDDRCVLLLGYKDQMEDMFQNVNPGLSRRFPLASGFLFEDFSQEQLATILDAKLKTQGFGITAIAKKVALDMLDRARNRPHFGNAGEIDILLDQAKGRHQRRLSAKETKRVSDLEALDFDENYRRTESSDTNVRDLFKDTVGLERLIATLQGYQEAAQRMRLLGMDPKEDIPFNFLFRGPPGTGKSTTARKMGKVFYDAGFLAAPEVIDCSSSDIIGQYIGQTGPKVRQQLDKALGRVLLIDEAYRLAEGHFAKEALDEIIDAVTKEKYHKKLIIVLAGYDDDINRLLNVNPGLTSRFPESIDFHGLDPDECFQLLANKLTKRKSSLEEKGKGRMNVGALQTPSKEFRDQAVGIFDILSKLPSWGSARDVDTLGKGVSQAAIKTVDASNIGKTIVVSEEMVIAEMEKMLKERQGRATQANGPMPTSLRRARATPQSQPQPQSQNADPSTRETSTATSTATTTKVQDPWLSTDLSEEVEETDAPTEAPEPQRHRGRDILGMRDPGVSNEVWEQLQKDADEEARREAEYQAKVKASREAKDDALREQIIRELMAEEEQRKEEEERKKKLELSGRCPVGYHWIRQDSGWRCAGGSHFVSEMDLVSNNG